MATWSRAAIRWTRYWSAGERSANAEAVIPLMVVGSDLVLGHPAHTGSGPGPPSIDRCGDVPGGHLPLAKGVAIS
jgi:hypothetical protein